MSTENDDISSDMAGALATLTRSNNLPALPQERPGLPATDGRQEERKERLPAPTQQESEEQREEDDKLHPDEQEQKQKQKPAVRLPSKAPVAWKNELKTKWADLPAEVQDEISRREREVAQLLSRTDGERKYANTLYNIIRPYEALLQKLGTTHDGAVSHLLQMAHKMHTATVEEKAEIIAELFFRHQVPIQAVDAVLVRRMQGQQGGAPAIEPIRQLVQQELAPVREMLQGMRQASVQTTQASVQQELDALYKDPLIGDMIEHVREDIADLLEAAGRQGRVLNLREAAKRAILANDDLAGIYQQRQLASAAQSEADKASKARRAGASLSNDGTPSARQDDSEGDGSVGADLRASIASLSRSQR
jgi:hypothetical protein